MKIAILACDDFSVRGGAERLIIDFSRALGADIIVPTFDEEVARAYDKKREIKMISLGKQLPGEPMRQLAGMRLFEKANLDYDFFITTDDMSLRYLVNDVPHFSFFHTPRRAMYDMYYPFLADHRGIKKIGYWGALNLFKYFDRRFVTRYVKNIACNSHNVRNRIYKVYQREARVLYPPVHVSDYSNKPPEGYWLSVGRVDKWKRIPLQVEAFRQIPDKTLLVVGQIYPALQSVVDNAPENVKFIGPCDESHLIDLYSRCEGFITTAIDEDFGITPLEAMASGKPVVATKEGGYLETVADGYTGLLISPDIGSVITAVREISENPLAYTDKCLKRAEKFDYKVFEKAINQLVRDCIENQPTT
jgi:glycosyltransferase involved in cell wall biosynthesis